MHCLEKVADLHMDMGDFPGKEARPSVVRLQDPVGHKFTMVSQTVEGVTALRSCHHNSFTASCRMLSNSLILRR